ncbi:FMN-dependent monooxygenase [Rhodococcus sp. ACS1]|uniref:LLM class flavin-dependent oxidoreductase n=2 Tax=Nocardiaceae TaxID=85025 RepID=UPI00029CAF28|nr:LLM class flavin-dependent oxidoreductase [Rhodococcus sp. ACPA1]AHK34493.1 Dibenzothiophene desulfurization enzyme A [Rhodococcus opacus PD630]KXF49134.1 monooxygenase [Rhodococcus sp. SC4]KXX55700.1 monooxygenase [Rhodococcus sp. LB1]PBC39403.1 FMN-dependent monooxygenase [Rhodococcus sp. ACS1]TQC45172.1 LLM class flavin-dependent oxidoreductase [Rhodococcus sp. WS4]
MTRMMNLIGYLKTGPTALHSGGWRHPEATLDDIFDPVRYEHMAQTLEAAKFDGAFFADLFGVADTYKGLEMFIRSGGQNSYLDPLTVLPIMARVTTRLGLGVTISTSFHNAFHIARSLASIDMLSKGRVAWNVVTSTSELEAANAGLDGLPPHGERYDRADEVLEACSALWNTWDDDPFIFDKRRGVFGDTDKVHYADYQGKWVKSRGPLPTPRSPQGHPVIMQAGSSDRGREFAARWAEVVFTRPGGRAEMVAFYEDMKRQVVEAGRDPISCKILPGVTPILGETDSIARERADYLDSLQHSEYDLAYASLSVGADLSKHQTLEEVSNVRGNQGTRGRTDELNQFAEKSGVTLAEAAAKRSRGGSLVGTPESVADELQDLFESGACDGFVIMPTTFPGSHEQFCRSVVPELQRRGVFRKEYSASTLRGNLLS